MTALAVLPALAARAPGLPAVDGGASVADWIAAISSAVGAMAAMGAFLVGLWMARPRRGPAPERRGVAAPGSSRLLRLLLRLFGDADAHRYENEWGAHLSELEQEAGPRRARRDRRRLVRRVPLLALELRLRSAARALRRRFR